MPSGAPYHSFVHPYAIRVDAFATPRNAPDFAEPELYLLTHTHSDHLNGLASTDFGSRVVCSKAAKNMLLRVEKAADRIKFDKREISSKVLQYSHLRKVARRLKDGTLDHSLARDLLVPFFLFIEMARLVLMMI